jgi:enoyl-CoA hydratase/carnithine racemase
MVPSASLIEESVKLADEMGQWPPLALRMSKRALQHNFEAELDSALRYESVCLGLGRKAINDVKESQAAFLEKRKPTYTGT